ncbi:MAG: rRNA maturation RNase YbeY [Alphaproteobacteria bacterium]|nr:rRNA maturation RNase YbeY [Alphaproteobacteria bacterium]MBU1527224.1 rRNA maturation RNase YbeY [Alphaproteobacteria bacterium]MBU2118439.1 rRNA maturation RNase YbeY [Alphaproteobacteria bacterium]MBU2351168.1 rRNA maturation RNase YbeY [Alphaproteobacteria bacterium]MBU2381886.1 rRNA maturation RNase YbeY [Alphaproteobacteria bacterium]
MVDVEVEVPDWQSVPDVGALVDRAVRAALGGEAAAVTVLLTDDAAQAELNARFRGRDGSTNVLSFPAPDSARPHLGDLSLAWETCRSEAEAQGKTLADHLTHLTVHGVLHLRGRDHTDDAEAEAMEAEERTILAGLGVPDPYRAEASQT